MKLVLKKIKVSKDEFPKTMAFIEGSVAEAKKIEIIDNLIGAELTGMTVYSKRAGQHVPETWKQMASTDCAEYGFGQGIVWEFDTDYIDDFKALYKKHKEDVELNDK